MSQDKFPKNIGARNIYTEETESVGPELRTGARFDSQRFIKNRYACMYIGGFHHYACIDIALCLEKWVKNVKKQSTGTKAPYCRDYPLRGTPSDHTPAYSSPR